MDQLRFGSMAGVSPRSRPRVSDQEKKQRKKEYDRKYYEKNEEKLKEQQRKYYEKPEYKEKMKVYRKNWRRNPEYRERRLELGRKDKIGTVCQFDGCEIDDIDMLMIHHLFPGDKETTVVLCANHHLKIDHFKEGFYNHD